MGLLPGSCCPHYDLESQRRPVYERLIGEGNISDGVAIGDGAAAHFVGTELAGGITSLPESRVVKVRNVDGVATEEPVEMTLLR
jgi:hypothetical protein